MSIHQKSIFFFIWQHAYIFFICVNCPFHHFGDYSHKKKLFYLWENFRNIEKYLFSSFEGKYSFFLFVPLVPILFRFIRKKKFVPWENQICVNYSILVPGYLYKVFAKGANFKSYLKWNLYFRIWLKYNNCVTL